MKRSRAFILSEQLMTMMLQAGFILVLCTSFYQIVSFYTRTQQVLAARSHAERVISFVDDKIRNAGLGLWRCKNSSDIRSRFQIEMLKTRGASNQQGYRLPIALQNGFKVNGNQGTEVDSNGAKDTSYIPLLSLNQDSGDVLTLLYAQRSFSSAAEETISAFKAASTYSTYSNTATPKTTLKSELLDTTSSNPNNPKNIATSLFDSNTIEPEKNIKRYAVMEGFGFPMNMSNIPFTGAEVGNVTIDVYGVQSEAEAKAITVPAAGELLALNCMQMFVHGTDGSGEGRQFAFRELQADGSQWDKTYNQEKGILDIYMELDKEHSVFTLWVLASGGYDASLNNPRPETWPEKARPTSADWGKQVTKDIRDYTNYPHHIVYVSRASWKLNNTPPNFVW